MEIAYCKCAAFFPVAIAMVIELIDKLLDRAIQVFGYAARQRSELLEKGVEPVFAQFELVHAAYLENFTRYREFINTSKDPNWISSLQATMEKENLFSANSRSKLLNLAEAEHKEVVGPFVKAIADYLMGARLLDPVGKKLSPQTQRWRTGLSRRLGWIAEENWQLVIDPDGAAPPMDPSEIEPELKRRRVQYPVDLATGEQDATRRAFALSALDGVVGEMQSQYDEVSNVYAELRTSLR
jgi:hypothetical protein